MAGKNDTTQIRDSEGHKTTGKPNINNVGRDEFAAMNITGLTEKRINAIIDYRDEHGPFKTMKDIEKVPMIGHTMEVQIEDHFVCE